MAATIVQDSRRGEFTFEWQHVTDLKTPRYFRVNVGDRYVVGRHFK